MEGLGVDKQNNHGHKAKKAGRGAKEKKKDNKDKKDNKRVERHNPKDDMRPSTFNPSRAWAHNKPSELQPHHEMDSLSSRKRKINAPLKAFEQNWHLTSIEADVETANVLVFMNRATTHSDNGTNKKEASHSPCQEEYKHPEDIPRVLTEQAQLVNDRPPKACPLCPVCSKGLQLLPSDTNFMEPFRSATFSKYANDHSNKFHRHEPLWNALSNLDLECVDTDLILRMQSDAEASDALVAQCLAIAARSMRTQNNKAWAECWSRVKALALARIGSAHCSVSSAKLYTCQGVKTEMREVERKNAEWIKGEAKSYLAALLGSLEATPPPSLWQADLMDLRIDLLSLFFMDGANHRQHGFIHPDFLPRSRHF